MVSHQDSETSFPESDIFGNGCCSSSGPIAVSQLQRVVFVHDDLGSLVSTILEIKMHHFASEKKMFVLQLAFNLSVYCTKLRFLTIDLDLKFWILCSSKGISTPHVDINFKRFVYMSSDELL